MIPQWESDIDISAIILEHKVHSGFNSWEFRFDVKPLKPELLPKRIPKPISEKSKNEGKYEDELEEKQIELKEDKKVNKKTEETIRERKAIIANLKKNTEVLEVQFEQYGLKVSSWGYQVGCTNDGSWYPEYAYRDYYLTAFVELISTSSQKLGDEEYNIMVILYDENDTIVGRKAKSVDSSNFDGYNTFEFNFEVEGIALSAQKARIVITKG